MLEISPNFQFYCDNQAYHPLILERISQDLESVDYPLHVESCITQNVFSEPKLFFAKI